MLFVLVLVYTKARRPRQDAEGQEHIDCLDHNVQLKAKIAFKFQFFGAEDDTKNTHTLKKCRDLITFF